MSETRYYGVCSSPTCKIIKLVDWRNAHERLPCYCPKCGSQLIVECPHCGQRICHKDGVFCFYCAGPFKAVIKVRRSRTAVRTKRQPRRETPG